MRPSCVIRCVMPALVVLSGSVAALRADEPLLPLKPTKEQLELVKQLGAASFTDREAAATRLRKQGLAARPALMQALRDHDLEVRMRAHQILITILQGDFESRLAAFLADVEDKQDHGLPGWKRFRKSYGSDRIAREFYVEMLRAEAQLLESLEDGSQSVGELYSEAVKSWQKATFSNLQGNGKVNPATLAALLFLGSQPDVTPNSTTGSQMFAMLRYPTVKDAVTKGKHVGQVKKLLSDWIMRRTTSTQAYYGLMLALTYDLKDAGKRLGREVLTQKGQSSYVLQYAIIAMGRFGNEEDIGLLEQLLENETVCHTWSNQQLKKDGVIRIEIRDVALAMLIRLTGQDHTQYGFKFLRENPTTVFYIHTFGFLENEQREAAVAKWRSWSAGNKRKQDADAP